MQSEREQTLVKMVPITGPASSCFAPALSILIHELYNFISVMNFDTAIKEGKIYCILVSLEVHR